jgi:hypothetical protein
MNDLIPRLKAIIGSLKPFAIVVAMLAVVLLIIFGTDLLTAVRNINGPQTVTIGQLVKGEVGRGQYVTVSGVAQYNAGYTETEDGRTVADYYMKTKTYGITVSRKETDWAVFLEPGKVDRIEAGTLYGWKNRPALQVHYRDPQGKSQELTISFEQPEALAGSLELFQRMGFSVRPAA